ncbi:MAG: DUF4329 domain-containing protein, partial [Gammaproteobacteria bacterium]|nr:DUF4329 domain-containing protein [Gammaproteobacteria bacterium]
IGFDVVHAAYDAASAMANLREDHILNFYRPTLERSGGHGGQMLAIDAGEDPWMSAVLIMAGIINGENNRSMLGEHLLEEFSNWFKVILASNVADAENIEEIKAGSNQAAIEALSKYNPYSIRDNREFGGYIYRNSDGTFSYTSAEIGDATGIDIGPAMVRVPIAATVVGEYHTHGDYSNSEKVRVSSKMEDFWDSDNFSQNEDIPGITERARGRPYYQGYLGTPSGEFKVLNTSTGIVDTLRK